ncbi:hypothetical protein BXZ70DRAFT_1012929 [Cristinia sonorae]|uniref:Methyltransferase FkbM domain-containing protein n=1 Tax=Cristinia sonorae TaxID=1940300 RepID=A0A8K0XJS8_9AGAR|nr:hypothetical protein BXZ70DRAFT_1012929 [Cristinia sonorae]
MADFATAVAKHPRCSVVLTFLLALLTFLLIAHPSYDATRLPARGMGIDYFRSRVSLQPLQAILAEQEGLCNSHLRRREGLVKKYGHTADRIEAYVNSLISRQKANSTHFGTFLLPRSSALMALSVLATLVTAPEKCGQMDAQEFPAGKRPQIIDVLKVDVEGSEFESLEPFFRDYINLGEVLPVGQMQIEIHAMESSGYGTFVSMKFRKWWEDMEKVGLRPFWTEPNMVYYMSIVRGARPDLGEYSFMNIRGEHALVSDKWNS